jgi:hypothetical protein
MCGYLSVINLTLNKLENVGGLVYNTHQTTNEGEKMEIGQTYTTIKSGVTGVIKAVDNHPSGVNRILLDVNGKERWTSAPAN